MKNRKLTWLFILSILVPVMSQAQTKHLDAVPLRSTNAITGTTFANQTVNLSGRQRQNKAIVELKKGNIPNFLRTFQPVRLTYKPANGDTLVAIIYVAPDYLAIGSDDDFLRMPLTYPSATAIANSFGCVLPTRKMVDAIYEQATCHLTPEPLPPGPKMRSSEYYLKHRSKIKTQYQKGNNKLGELTAGHKKDVVITNRLNKKPGRIAIYGWQRPNGKPIQPLSTIHDARYADYSHGIRLIHQTVYLNGEPRLIFDVLKDPKIALVLTYEGQIPNPRELMGKKTSPMTASRTQ